MKRLHEVLIDFGQSTWKSNVELTPDEAQALRVRCLKLESTGKLLKDHWYVNELSTVYTLSDVTEFLKHETVKPLVIGDSYYVSGLNKGLCTLRQVTGNSAVVEAIQQLGRPWHTVPVSALW